LGGVGLLALRTLRRRGLGEPTVEPLDAAPGVDQLLLAGEEGVALRAELDAQGGNRGAGGELVAARAVHLALDVLGVDVGLHDRSILERFGDPIVSGVSW